MRAAKNINTLGVVQRNRMAVLSVPVFHGVNGNGLLTLQSAIVRDLCVFAMSRNARYPRLPQCPNSGYFDAVRDFVQTLGTSTVSTNLILIG